MMTTLKVHPMTQHRRKQPLLVYLILALVGRAFVAQGQSIGTMTPLTKFTLHSEILKDDRKIAIYRPPVLKEFPDNVPPVIYVLDGELTTDLERVAADNGRRN
jgi:enterochelin esterase-like enzyme